MKYYAEHAQVQRVENGFFVAIQVAGSGTTHVFGNIAEATRFLCEDVVWQTNRPLPREGGGRDGGGEPSPSTATRPAGIPY